MKKVKYARETLTILEALRFWQQSAPLDLDLTGKDGDVELLSAEEVDTFCEDLNLGDIVLTSGRHMKTRRKRRKR